MQTYANICKLYTKYMQKIENIKFKNNNKIYENEIKSQNIKVVNKEIKVEENNEWMKIVESTPEFKNNSSEGLRTRYRDLQKRRLNP